MAKISYRVLLFISCILFLSIFTVEALKTQEELSSLWNQWLSAVQPTYINDQAQKDRRFEIFKKTIQYLQEQNNPALGLTKFADLNESQLQAIKGYLSNAGRLGQFGNRRLQIVLTQTTTTGTTTQTIPTTFDWRDYGVVSAVKDQGLCGNCWAFSTTGFFESQMVRRLRASSEINLAQQFFLQCDSKSDGCKGGFLDTAMDIGLKNGVPYEAQFPWNSDARYTRICSATIKATIENSARVTYLTGLSVEQIKALLIQRPLNIAVAAKDWHNYAPGSDKTYRCPQSYSNYNSLDHTVLLVGWTNKQWIIKNQWGTDWGVNGYIYVSIADYEDCGIGWQVHTLDYKLSAVDTTNASITTTITTPTTTTTNSTDTTATNTTTTIVIPSTNPTNVRVQVPVALVCPLSNCQTCYYGSPSCQICKDGYQLNTLTKYCEVAKIPNCVQFSKWAGYYQCVACITGFELKNGSCASPGFNAPTIEANKVTIVDPFASIPASYYTKNSSCELNFCQVCYDNGNKCLTCMSGYAVNQITSNCQKSPIDGCNLFTNVRDIVTCFECKKGYQPKGYFVCQSTTAASNSTASN